jgi:inorganic triphosphatase YgiF
MLATARVPLRWRWEGQRSQGSSREGPLSRFARGKRLFASNARYGPSPAPLAVGRSALAGKLEGGTAFALCAREGLDRFQCSLRSESRSAGGKEVRDLRSQGSSREGPLSRFARGKRLFASNARSDPSPAPLAVGRSALAGKLGQGIAFALCAREEVVRFQCSLRPESRSAGGRKACARREARRRIGTYRSGSPRPLPGLLPLQSY